MNKKLEGSDENVGILRLFFLFRSICGAAGVKGAKKGRKMPI